MRISVASLIVALPLSAAVAQVPPRPPVARRPAETPRPPRPAEAPRPLEWPTPEILFESHWALPVLPALPALPLAELTPLPAIAMEWDALRHETMDQLRWEREMDRHLMQEQRETARLEQQRAREFARIDHDMTPRLSGWPGVSYHSQGDPADSLYRQGHELLRRGEYRRAAAVFRELPTKFPASAYQADALYWQAFALYRIGGSAELRAALDALEQHRTKYPGAKNRTDAGALTTRITGALAARGDASATAQIRNTATDSALRCDSEEQEVRAAALNALVQSDPEGAMPLLQRTLSRKDECTVRLRRTAVFLAGSKGRDAATVTLLAQAARTDPSHEVRGSALEFLAPHAGRRRADGARGACSG